METEHRIHYQSAGDLSFLDAESIDLVVTSPPYPMIAMWDEMFAAQDREIALAPGNDDSNRSFELMHRILDRTWRECHRVIKPGGFACINIGDATRTVGGNFRLFTNHSRITAACEEIGFQSLPAIIWRKQTNAPNKFMGSGMLPAGAYVTLEHEYILVFRKGGKRVFGVADKERRRRSAFFWEERNRWFSDLWDFKGVQQKLGSPELRARSGAFPLELPFRLITMYSLQEDAVLDPFAGTGTTICAAVAAGRNSLGIEIDPTLASGVDEAVLYNHPLLNARQNRRLQEHREFVEEYRAERDYQFKHHNRVLDTPVMTGQETELWLPGIQEVARVGDSRYRVRHGAIGDCPSHHGGDAGGAGGAGKRKGDGDDQLGLGF